MSSVGWGVGFLDYDNDGRLDVFVANGSTFEEPEDTTRLKTLENFLFRNQGARRFVLANDVTGEVWKTGNVGRGASYADYDNDGDLDILILAHGEGVRLLQNEGGNKKNWLTLDLKAPPGNRQAVGARVIVSAGGTEQLGGVIIGSSYLSTNDPRPHFGLGDSELADWVEIRWPDGDVQRLTDIAANQILAVSKGGQ